MLRCAGTVWLHARCNFDTGAAALMAGMQGWQAGQRQIRVAWQSNLHPRGLSAVQRSLTIKLSGKQLPSR